MSILYLIVGILDGIIYRFAATLFRVIMALKDVQFFDQLQIKDIANRVYMILGVLILFEIVISAVQYIVNPDKFDDKEKGFYGLLQKTVITIVLILIVPVVFDFARSIEDYVVESLPSIILGADSNQNTEDIGEDLSFTVLSSFVSANSGKGGSVGPNGQIHDIESFNNYVAIDCSLFGVNTCRYNYFVIVSTICGGFLCYVLASMALDIAVRSIKLGIIQMLSPIPISTYVFGKDKFNKFVKMSLQVYADLFIRMAIVYFIIFAFSSLTKNGVIKYSSGSDWFFDAVVNLMIIFGLLMFAKSAPKFLSDLLGLPEITGGDMADMFKPVWSRVGGFSSPAAAIGAYRNAREYGEKPWTAARRAVTAGAHATVARLRDVASGKSLSESYKSSRDAAMARTNKNLEYRNRYDGFRERHHQIWQERFDNYTGVTSGGKRTNATVTAATKALKARGDSWSRAEQKVLDVHGAGYTATVTSSITGTTYHLDELLTRIDVLKSAGSSITPDQEAELNWLQSQRDGLLGEAKKEYIFKALSSHDAAGNATGDGRTRNEFAQNMQEFLRSGGDGTELSKIARKTVTDVKGPDGTNYGTVTLDIGDVVKRISNGLAISDAEAAAISQYIKSGLEADAGNMKRRAENIQTTIPKDNK